MNVYQAITIAFSAVTILFCILTFSRNGRKDSLAEKRTKEAELREEMNRLEGIKESLLKLNIKSDTICATTNETRSDIKSMNNKIQSLDKEVEILKRDVQTAFIRIDELKGDN